MSNQTAYKLSCAMKIFGATTGIALALLVAITVLSAPTVSAQSTSSHPRPAFEVASVKPLDRALILYNSNRHQIQGDRFFGRTDLFQFIVRAYLGGSSCVLKAVGQEVCPLISGLPGWVKTEGFEIQAKLPSNFVAKYTNRQLRWGDTPEINLMLQILLEDRFHLKVHWETREIPVYVLAVGKNPLKLKETPLQGEFRKQPDGSLYEVHGIDTALCNRGTDGIPRCTMNFRASSLQEVADGISAYLDRPVVDRTGLKGNYDFTIDSERDAALPPGNLFVNPFSGFSASMFSEGLLAVGIRLESTTAPMRILVIDHVEKPSEN